jgi:hypothetical protein
MIRKKIFHHPLENMFSQFAETIERKKTEQGSGGGEGIDAKATEY